MAMPPAAAAPDKNEVGKVQNTGSDPNTPQADTDSASIFNAGWGSKVDTAMPPAATASAMAQCHLRSRIRSDRRPQYTMANVPTM